MNFFKSVFSDEPDSPKLESESKNDQSDATSPSKQQQNPSHDDHDSSAGWSFGGLIKTLTTKSESVIEVYRRDLQEFGSGLKKEIEVAHGSLETVSHAIDEIGTSVLKGTAQIISQGKDAILANDNESDSSDNNNERSISSQQSLNSKPYSRFDAQVRLIQADVSTYSEEPEDLDDYKKWKSGFVLEEKKDDFESLIQENGGVIEKVYKKVVPNTVDEETFWSRYYYKLFKLKQAEDLRANLVKRAISAEEEDLSWDDDDDDDEHEPLSLKKNDETVKSDETNKMDDKEFEQTLNIKKNEIFGEESKGEKAVISSDNVASETIDLDKSMEVGVSKSDEKAGSEGKGDNGESSKDSDVSVISSHPSMPEEEDLGWDEIEDLSSIDDKKVSYSGSPDKADLRKRLSAAEEDEDLSWDIEDDDEPVKA